MRCYFNLITADQTLVDHQGVEVADLKEAHAIVAEVATEMLQCGEAPACAWRGWRLEVVDALGTVLITVRLDAPLS